MHYNEISKISLESKFVLFKEKFITLYIFNATGEYIFPSFLQFKWEYSKIIQIIIFIYIHHYLNVSR